MWGNTNITITHFSPGENRTFQRHSTQYFNGGSLLWRLIPCEVEGERPIWMGEQGKVLGRHGQCQLPCVLTWKCLFLFTGVLVLIMYGRFGWFLEISCNLLDVSIEKLCNCAQVARSKYWHKQIEFSWSVISTCTICTWFVHCHCYCRDVSIIIVYKWRRVRWMWLSFEMK